MDIDTQITPAYIEQMIDKAGRNKVFSLASAMGWDGSAPLWVWQGLCNKILNGE